MDSATIARQLAAHDSKRVTTADAMNEAGAQYGLPEIRKTVSGLRTTIDNTGAALKAVDPSVTGRTSQSLVTEAQRQKMVANERAPIAEQLGEQTGLYNKSSEDLKYATDQATQMATAKVNDWNMGRQALSSQYDMTYKKEQDTKAEAMAREQAALQQRERDRNYQLAVQQASQKGSSVKAASPAEVKLQVSQTIERGLSGKVGKDGKVSNETWAGALSDAVASGFTVREFWQKYGRYVNTKYKSKYAGFNQR